MVIFLEYSSRALIAFAKPTVFYIRLWGIILLSLVLLSSLAQAQNTRIKYLGLDDGISQVSIHDMLKDQNGFVWIATQDGLNRFDGKEFKVYKYSETDTLSISGNYVSKILEDQSGKIWAGTIGDGISFYDPVQDLFHRIALSNSSDNNENISDFASDKNGNVWVTSKVSGLHRLRSNSTEQSHFYSGEALGALSLDEKDQLWIGSLYGRIFKVDPTDTSSFKTSPEIVVQGAVRSFYHTDQYLLIGCDLGLYIYDYDDKSIKNFNLAEKGQPTTQHISSFLKENESEVWIGTGNGLYLFNWKTQSVSKNISYSEDQNISLSNGTVETLLRISGEQIYVGTANSLNQLDFSEPYFKNISKNLRGDHLLNDNVIFSVFKDGFDLWIGTSDGGLNLIRNGKNYFFNVDQNEPNSISGSVVRSIVKDDKNERLWIATTRGLNMIDLKNFDPNEPKFMVFKHLPTNLNSINNDFLKDLVLDANQNLWGVTYGQGIFRLEFNPENDYQFFRYRNSNSNNNSLGNDFGQCIRTDKDGNIWIGTQAGLTKLSFDSPNYSNPIFENYERQEGQDSTLSHNTVYDILFDKDNKVWVGTRHGLNLFLGDNKFQSWTENNQFPNAIVYSIQDDDEGQLWLGTNNGIVKFDPAEEVFTHYGIEDGIQSKEFDLHAKFKDKYGNIYFGGIGGLTYFHPDDLLRIDLPKPLYFSELRIKSEIIDTKSKLNKLLKESLLTTKSLTFNNSQFPFYLKFSSLDFRTNKKVEYGYKLLPNNEDWNMLKDPEIQFLNLPTGSHTLLVNGFARGEEWDQEPLQIELVILPPWWATWWAYSLYFICLALLTYYLYRFQLSRKLAVAESLRLKEVNLLKSSLYTNITHEFRTPLTVILGMVDTIRTHLNEEKIDSTSRPLALIERNGNKLLKLVNELLATAKAENGELRLNLIQTDVIPFVKYIGESFQSLAAKSDIQLTIYSEKDSLLMDFDPEKLSIILSNLISNALKFTLPSGKILIHIKEDKLKTSPSLFIKVKDTGMGIPADTIPHIFDRFYQVDSSSSRMKDGTGIGLALTKEFVSMMKGSISVKSEIEKGSEFTIQLPISRNSDLHTEVNLDEIYSPHTELGDRLVIEPVSHEESNLPRVLIIEDNVDVAYYLQSCLGDKYDVTHSLNGDEGIKLAFELIPDIIICDVMMPIKNGYEVCSTLKSDERTDHIPIIILTAKATSQDRITGLSNGADAFLSKPFNKVELLTRLDQLILLRTKMTKKYSQDGFTSFFNRKSESPEAKFLKRAISIIHKELEDPDFSSRHLAFRLNLSESQVYRKLKAITGKSTAVFIRSIRLQQAKELLQTTEKTIAEVAYAVGFNDPSWFSKAFKEEFGFTPSAIHK